VLVDVWVGVFVGVLVGGVTHPLGVHTVPAGQHCAKNPVLQQLVSQHSTRVIGGRNS
jgi:hypothetical protein